MLKEGRSHRILLRVFAAAYAEVGDFEAAIETQTEALDFTYTRRHTTTIKNELWDFRQGQPLRKKKGAGWD